MRFLIPNNNLSFKSYYNAKLLLTSEYLVLNGAKALAVPLKFGQRLSVEENEQGIILWQAIANDGFIWFSGKYSLKDFSIIESSHPDIAIHPQRLLVAAKKLNPDFCHSTVGYHVISTLNYPLLWGLGSSSTLIAAIAGWAGIDPFKLHFEVSKGSGYDIACAISDGPIIYSLKGNKPEFERVSFSPSFANKIYFVYQGNKQDSAEGIQKYRNRNSNPEPEIIGKANLLADRMLRSSSLLEFEKVMLDHEIMISNLLETPSIRQTVFTDLPGEVKSLGAWGGDFCMLTWHDDPGVLSAYLKSKGLETWFNYNDIVL
ncbi:MAG: GYDIA family GHMP kinase [Bacteroidales bacterium]|nr:GYDIA family GHMP kinase [Bacteroidales bacterium]